MSIHYFEREITNIDRRQSRIDGRHRGTPRCCVVDAVEPERVDVTEWIVVGIAVAVVEQAPAKPGTGSTTRWATDRGP